MKKEIVERNINLYFKESVVLTERQMYIFACRFKHMSVFEVSKYEDKFSDDPKDNNSVNVPGYIKRTIDVGHKTYYLSEHKDSLEDLYNEVINLPPVNHGINTAVFLYPEYNGVEITVGNYNAGIDIWYDGHSLSYTGELTLEKFKDLLMHAGLGYNWCSKCKQWFDRTTQMRHVWAGLYCPDCFNTPEVRKRYDDMMSYHD